jgi:hypothetical protein
VPATIGCVVYAWRLAESLHLVAPPPGLHAPTGAMH